MLEKKKIVMKRNGKSLEKGMIIEIPESINSIDRLQEILLEEYSIQNANSSKFFNSDGTSLSGDILSTLTENDTIYIEPQSTQGFDYNNIIEQYKVLDKLGKGGYGSVHRAQHKDTGKIVAIKYIDITDCLYHASKVENIFREAQALKKLVHPNIVKLYNAFLWKNFVVLIMEYISGGELRTYVNNKGGGQGISETEARSIFLQLADAVEYCHSRSVIHRDLKPENILLADSTSNTIKLIDFGIAGSTLGKTKETTISGSLHYMPPEVFASSNPQPDPAIDVWAMGVILYVIIYGFFPFRGKTETEIKKSIATSKVVFPKEKKLVSLECKKFITALLDKDPKKRISLSDIRQMEWLTLPEEKLMLFDEKVKKALESKDLGEEDKKSPAEKPPVAPKSVDLRKVTNKYTPTGMLSAKLPVPKLSPAPITKKPSGQKSQSSEVSKVKLSVKRPVLKRKDTK